MVVVAQSMEAAHWVSWEAEAGEEPSWEGRHGRFEVEVPAVAPTLEPAVVEGSKGDARAETAVALQSAVPSSAPRPSASSVAEAEVVDPPPRSVLGAASEVADPTGRISQHPRAVVVLGISVAEGRVGVTALEAVTVATHARAREVPGRCDSRTVIVGTEVVRVPALAATPSSCPCSGD